MQLQLTRNINRKIIAGENRLMKLTWNNKKWTQVLLHVMAWLVVFSLPYLFSSHYDENRPKNPDEEGFFYLNALTGLFWIGAFYLNAFVLTPRFIYRKKYVLYSVLLFGIFCFIMLAHCLFFVLFIHSRPFSIFNSIRFNLPTFILTIAVSTTYQTLAERVKADQLVQQKQAENLKTELSFLRSQISPHFMFNVLNNLIALIRIKSDQLEPTVFKLSSLMRYMIYETDEKRVLLSKEVEYLQNFIDLQEQRFGGKVKLNIAMNLPPDEPFEIEPMLLIPFVENAFKHGTGFVKNPQIDIDLHIKDKVLFFTAHNKFSEASTEVKDESSGIGLMNVTKRLNLLYPNQHSLLITRKDGWFSVSLQINLH